MAQEIVTVPINGTTQRRGRGRNKPFPTIAFEECLVLPKGILEHSIDGGVRRMTLMEKISLSPSSIRTRDLISSSGKYGLIAGNYNSDVLQLTEGGRALFEKGASLPEVRERQFKLAIEHVGPFSKLYEKLKGKKFPDETILKDAMGDVGVDNDDRENAAKIFEKNLRYVGLVKKIAGSEFVGTIDEVAQDAEEMEQEVTLPPATDSHTEPEKPVEKDGNAAVATNRPALHIDIQVHIDPTSSAEQIEQIFASMARHFCGPES